MRIGIDIRCLMEKYYSGVNEYTYNLLQYLFKIDQRNQYFLFYNAKKSTAVPKFDFPNVWLYNFHYPNKIFNLSLRFLKITTIDHLIGGVDIFLIPNFLFINLSNACKKILIVHDLSFEIYPSFFTLKKRFWHRLINPKKLSQQADMIIAVSENTKKDISVLYNINPEKIKVIYPGINQNFFLPVSEQERQRVKNKYQLNNDYIFFLGNLEPRKNVQTLLNAFSQLKNKTLDLVIAGSPSWKYQKIYQQRENSPVKSRIKFLGYVDNLDKPALYTGAKIFIYPSIYEGFGFPPLEAMACGTPVITGCNSSLTEIVDQAGLLVDPNNINDLAQSINQLTINEKLQASLKERGFKQAKKFNWSITAEAVLKLIESEIKN